MSLRDAEASPDAKLAFQAALITAAIGVLVAVGGSVVTYLLTKGDEASGPVADPIVTISSVEWLGDDGRYRVEGKIENLAEDQLVWTFNQPYEYDTDSPQDIYPDLGPCPTDIDGGFACELGYAGNSKHDGGRKFAIWVAVVTDEDAYEAAKVKSGLGGGNSAYSNAHVVPHVDGEETMAYVEKIHPGPRP